MYYSYVEIEYVAMSFSPARTDLALKLFLKPSSLDVRKRFGTGNLAGGAVKVFTWDWMDAALLHYPRGESTTYAGVLLD
jgi:hypothetical protein